VLGLVELDCLLRHIYEYTFDWSICRPGWPINQMELDDISTMRSADSNVSHLV
jgi:hypothetical protein